MDQLLIGVDEEWRGQVEKALEPVFKANGFAASYRSPISQVPDSIEFLAKMGGKADVVLLIEPPASGGTGIGTGTIAARSAAVAAAISIRELDDRTAFQGVVKAKAVPIVAFASKLRLADWPSLPLCRFEEPIGLEGIAGRIVELLLQAARDWQASVLDELENVGHAVTTDDFGRLTINPLLHRKRGEGVILTTEASPGSLRSSEFLILSKDIVEEYEPYRELQTLLETYKSIAAAEGIKEETVFQRFFEEHPHFLLRDRFEVSFPKPQLPISGGPRSYAPDFVQRPKVAWSVGTKWEILDLKLPEDKLTTSAKFHEDLSAKLHHAIRQLRNYRAYFNEDQNADALIRQFGEHPRNPKLAVVMGRRDRMADAHGLDQAIGPHNLDIEVVSYDEVLSLEARKLELWGRTLLVWDQLESGIG